MLHKLCNLTKKSNLIGRLQHDLTQFVDNLVVAYFWATLLIVIKRTSVISSVQ